MSWWSVFWGLFFVLLGVSIFLKVFGVDLPVFRIFAAILVIGLGVKLLMPGTWRSCQWARSSENETIFAESKFAGSGAAGNHRVIFGSTELDLRDVQIADKDVEFSYDVVFGALKIKVDPNKPIRVVGDAVFAGISLPNGNSSAFGHVTYSSPSFKESEPSIKVTVKTVFGGVEVE